MNDNLKSLLKLLNDGAFHSGESLGKKLGVTRGAIWKSIKQLDKYGIEVEAKTNLGYRISGGLELLDQKKIGQYINPKHKAFVNGIVIFDEIPSTNTYLAQLTNTPQIKNINICLAESQFAGKGRLGRQWVSPFARNIYLSLLWSFAKEPSELSGLSLAVAVSVAESLESYGIKDKIALKWPNDILWQNRKLAGILIELYGEANYAYKAIIGIGLNVSMPKKLSQKINQPWCDITQITEITPQRNKLIGFILDKLLETLVEFHKNGLKSFIKKWLQLDVTYGKKVTIITPQQQKVSGIGCGINNQGCFLCKDSNNNIQSFAVGEVSLKL